MSERLPPRSASLPETQQISSLLGDLMPEAAPPPKPSALRSPSGSVMPVVTPVVSSVVSSGVSAAAASTKPTRPANPAPASASAPTPPASASAPAATPTASAMGWFLKAGVNWTGVARRARPTRPVPAIKEELDANLMADIERPAIAGPSPASMTLKAFLAAVNWQGSAHAAGSTGTGSAGAFAPAKAAARVGRGEAFSVDGLMGGFAWD